MDSNYERMRLLHLIGMLMRGCWRFGRFTMTDRMRSWIPFAVFYMLPLATLIIVSLINSSPSR